jgi:CO/xanthine dehydrogenase Mo-binding subunit
VAEPNLAGQSIPRVDGPVKVTGRARYALDLTVPGMAHGIAVRSERAHAKIVAIDTAEAEAAPGVLKVVTGAGIAPLDSRFGHVVRDHPALAVDRVLYHGEPVALVVAETRRAAAKAARLVRVRYEDLPEVLDAEEALAPGAPVLHPPGSAERTGDEGFDQGGDADVGNLCASADVGWGDVEAGFAAADLIVEGEFRYPMLYGYAMEPYNAIAAFEEGSLTVHSTAQHPYMVREDLARIFNLPLARVRVVVPYVGGGYGTKSYTKVEPLAAIGAWATGRPVRVALTVEEAILTTRSDGAKVSARSAFAADGTLLAREFDVVMDSGAYTDNSPVVCAKLANRAFGPYRVPAVRVRVRSAFTNTVPASSLRGFGAPQGNLAGEVQMDEAAEQLGIDALEIRRRNVVQPGEEILPGKRGIDADLPADMDLLTESLGWPNAPEGGGIGFGISASDAGAHPTSVAAVRLHPDGSASAAVGATELGQGSRTVLSQILADALELPFERVAIVASDTGATPYERTTGASRTTSLVGRSLQAACADARRRVRELAAETAGVDAAAVADAPGGVRVGEQQLSYADVIKGWFGAGGEVIGVGAIRRHGEFKAMPPFWEIGCSGVRVRVDSETGRVTVEQLTTVGDVGFAINPALVHGQDLGAATMGLGAALYEELVYDGATLANPNVVDYRVPRAGDLPEQRDQILAERRDGIGPYGAKGAGEGALNPVGAAVAAAVGRTIGSFPHELPLTPERVWRLTMEAEARRGAEHA